MLAGLPSFGRPPAPGAAWFQAPEYLDYTGAQAALYAGMEWLSQHLGEQSGYVLWTALSLMVCAFVLIRRNQLAALIVLAAHPVVRHLWFEAAWEDKASFVAMPLLVSWLISERHLRSAAFAVGAIACLNGLTAPFVPAFCVHLWRERRTDCFAWLAVGAAVFMLPFFPSSLSGWNNRVARMNEASPFWYSVFRLLPQGWYIPALYKGCVAVGTVMATAAYAARRVSLDVVLAAACCLVMCFSVFSVAERSLPVILVIGMLARIDWRGWLAVSLALLAYYRAHLDIPQEAITRADVLLFHVPLLVVVLAAIACHRFSALESVRRPVASV